MWSVEYLADDDPETWEQLVGATIVRSPQELNGAENCTLRIINTQEMRTFLDTDQRIRVKYGSTTVFDGMLYGGDYATEELTLTIDNSCLEKLKKGVIDGEYADSDTSTVFAAICTAAGITAGTCPTVDIGVAFKTASTYDAMMFLVKATVSSGVPQDYWTSGLTFNIGVRGQSRSIPIHIQDISRRSISRGRIRNHAIARGKDETGAVIVGHAYTQNEDGTGNIILGEPAVGYNSAYYPFAAKNALDVATLESLAATELDKIRQSTSGSTIEVAITDGYVVQPGDTLTGLDFPSLSISGSYRVYKVTYQITNVIMDIDRRTSTVTQVLDELKSLEDQGIYIIGGGGEVNWDDAPEENVVNPGDVSGENLLLNGDFENDRDADGTPDYWTLATDTLAQANTDTYKGANALQLTTNTSGYAKQRVPIAANRKYRLKVAVKSSIEKTGTPCAVILQTSTYAYITTLAPTDTALEMDYKLFVVEFDTTDYPTARFAEVRLYGGTGD